MVIFFVMLGRLVEDEKVSEETSREPPHKKQRSALPLRVSDLSAVDGSVKDYHGYDGQRRIWVRLRRGGVKNGHHY